MLRLIAVILGLVALTSPARAEIVITDAYLRTATPVARTGAIYLTVRNTGTEADRLMAVETEIARRAELHTHIENADGLMQMRPVEEGFAVPPGVEIRLERGGDHVMLMGLTETLAEDAEIPVALIFESAGRVEIVVPHDRDR